MAGEAAGEAAGAYVFPLALTAAWKAQIEAQTRQKLAEMLGVEVDNVMAEYVIVMVGNKKDMAQIAHDLVDFIGEDAAQQFADWLRQLLQQFEAQASATASAQASTTASATAPAQEQAPAQEPKRVVSLKGISGSNGDDKKLAALSSGRGTIRSLSSAGKDASDVLARRSQRFGVVDKPLPERKPRAQQPEPKRDEGRAAGAKRKAGDQESAARKPSGGGRLSQLLGPPVNVDQAELDARDSLHKKKRPSRSAERERTASQPPRGGRGRSDRDDKDGDRSLKRRSDDDSARGPNKRRQDGDARERGGRDVAPPLPPPDDRPGSDRFAPGGRSGPQMGMFNGPPGYGGFPPPFGAPMFYPPPGYGPPPYGMGFPPQHGMPPPEYGQFPPYGAPMAPGPRPHAGRAPRPFQNRSWVNPNIAKSEAAEQDGGAGDAGEAENATSGGGPGLNASAPPYAPRNPFYSSQMRPRFQNKTWVRQDPAKEEELSSSLPKTPPHEALEG